MLSEFLINGRRGGTVLRTGETHGGDIPASRVLPFFVLTYAITWGLIGPFVLAPDWAAATFGEVTGAHPVFILATWGPAIAALVLVAARGGWRGVTGFLSRFALWRMPWGWWAFLLVGIPLIFVAGSLAKGGPVLAPAFEDGAATFAIVALIFLFLGPVEEIGWRGLAQPLLQRWMPPLWAAVLIGLIWGFWHLPAFYLPGTPQGGWGFLPFHIGSVALSTFFSAILNASRGSILIAALLHYQLINPLWPDAQPYDTIILVVLAIALVIWKREEMLGGSGAVTTVIPKRDQADTASLRCRSQT